MASESTVEAFGLNANASIICAENETAQIFNTILSLESSGSGGAGGGSGERTRDEILRQGAVRYSQNAGCVRC